MTPAHQYEDKLLEFAYGELAPHEASAVQAHVQTCERCASALAKMQSVRVTMAQLQPQPAPEAGLDSLLAYAQQAAQRNAQGRQKASGGWRRFLAPLTSVLALCTVGVVAFRANQDFEPRALVEVSPEPSPVAVAAAPPPPPAEAEYAVKGGLGASAEKPAPPAKQRAAEAKKEAPSKYVRTEPDALTPALSERLGTQSHGTGSIGSLAKAEAAAPAPPPKAAAAPALQSYEFSSDEMQGEAKTASSEGAFDSRPSRKDKSVLRAPAGRAQGDVETDLRTLAEALKANSNDEERSELLERLCAGYEKLGRADKAAPYCNELLRRFPDSAAAQRLAQRRGAPPPVPAAAPAERR